MDTNSAGSSYPSIINTRTQKGASTRFSFSSSTTTMPPRASFTALAAILILSPLPMTFRATRLLSRCFRRLRSRSFAQGMLEKRGCTACGGRARGRKSSREYHSLVTSTSRKKHETKRHFPPFPRLPINQSFTFHGLRSGLTSRLFKGIPRTDSFTPYVRLSCHLSSIRAVMLILDHSILSRGLFHRRLPMSPSSRACRNAGRWRQVGLWLGPRRQTKALRDLLLRSVSTLPSPCGRNGWPHAC
jgi:hypothetical protein